MIRARSILKLSAGILFSLQAWAAPVTLRDLHPRDEALLRREIPALFKPEGADLATLDQAIRVLIGQGTYENVYVDRKESGAFELVGKPLRLIEDIVISGTKQIDADDLRALIEIKPGDRFDRKRAVAAAEKIKNHYGEEGYFNAIVELNINKGENKNLRLNIDIQEKEPCRIKGLRFETANVDLKARLDARFRRVLNRPLTTDRGQKLMNDVNTFLIDQRYMATDVLAPEAKYNEAKTEAYIQIEIREPYRWDFFFNVARHPTEPGAAYTEGDPFLKTADIYRALDLRNRERKNVDPAGEGAERIRRAYLAAGFPNVEIETKVRNPAGTYLKRVNYWIKEGVRVRIKSIEVQGRISRGSSYYEKFIRENSSSLVRRGFYNRADLENGFKNLVTELRNQGFLRARALSSRVEYSEKRDTATVFLMLEEGAQTQIRALDFEGNRFFSSFELAQVTELETNAPLRLNDFEQSIEKIKNFYRNQGFLEMKLLNESEDVIQYNEKGTQARILFRIFEGPRIRVNNIVVEGNSFTKTRVILKEADFRLGEVLTPQKIEEATTRLNKMGLFSRADVRTMEEGTNVAERTLVISVAERDPGIFRFGGGVNNERGLTLRGFTGLGYNNLWGTGRAISGRVEVKSNVAEIDYPEHEITAGYFEPFLFNTRTRGRVNLTRSEQIFQYNKDNNITPITTINRIDLLAEREFNRHVKLTWKVWSLELRRERERNGKCIPDSDPDDPCPTNNTGGKRPAKDLQIGTIGPTLDIDYSDNRFLPTRGSFTRFIFDYSNPKMGSSDGVEFYRAEGNYTHYQPLGSPRFVWTNSLRSGYVKNLSHEKDSGVPTSYAFILGGIYTVRGFDSSSDNERIPKDQTNPQTGERFRIAAGNTKLIETDSTYYLIKSELRFPISGDHGGVLFYDGGAVYITGYDFSRPYRDAVGVGYRYNTPVGPLAADFAFKINPERREKPREEIFRFHLSIGTF